MKALSVKQPWAELIIRGTKLTRRWKRHRFAEGPWCWILAAPARFEEPHFMPGKLGLFDVDID